MKMLTLLAVLSVFCLTSCNAAVKGKLDGEAMFQTVDPREV